MNNSQANSQTIFGWFELDLAGTVLYSKPYAEDVSDLRKSDFTGKNFFENLLPAANAEEVRRHFDDFAVNCKILDEFTFDCQFEDNSVKVKILLMRVTKRRFYDYKKLIIADVRQV